MKTCFLSISLAGAFLLGQLGAQDKDGGNPPAPPPPPAGTDGRQGAPQPPASQPGGGEFRPNAPGQGGPGFPGGPGGPNNGPRFVHPLMAALDLNKDGTIDAEEIGKAAESLKKLDKNGDGKITEDEYRPPRFGPGGPPNGNPPNNLGPRPGVPGSDQGNSAGGGFRPNPNGQAGPNNGNPPPAGPQPGTGNRRPELEK